MSLGGDSIVSFARAEPLTALPTIVIIQLVFVCYGRVQIVFAEQTAAERCAVAVAQTDCRTDAHLSEDQHGTGGEILGNSFECDEWLFERPVDQRANYRGVVESCPRDYQRRGGGRRLNLSSEELAFYDALTRPEAVRDFYTNEQLIAITRELTEALRNNKTIDWNMKESAQAGMRRIVKRLLKKYDYPPAGQEDALDTIMTQCRMWNENN